MGNLSIRCFDRKTPGQELCPPQRSSASMSFSWLFLGEVVSTRARLRFTNRGQHAVNSVRRSSLLQRTANYLLTVCLTPGGKRTDILLRGDEEGLGTPAEDMASLAAVAAMDVPT